MAFATIVVLLFLFNRMMNVISMMDNFGANVISTQGGTIMLQYMKDVAAAMMHIDSRSRQAEKQYSILNGSDHFSCAELQRTLFHGGSSGMDDVLFGVKPYADCENTS
jgi:hypothetical protein